MIFGNVDVSLREALDKGWQNGGKRWQTGGKLLTFLRFLCSIRLTLVEPRGNKYCCGEQKGLLYYEYDVFLYREQAMHREQSF